MLLSLSCALLAALYFRAHALYTDTNTHAHEWLQHRRRRKRFCINGNFNRKLNMPLVCKQLAIVNCTWTSIDKTHKLLTLLFYVHASAAICLKIQQHKATRIVRTRLYRSTLFLFMAKLGMFIVSSAYDISKRCCYRKLQLQFKLVI